MPVARYFLWVGSVLLALLFIADACLPKLPAGRAADTQKVVVRIHSDKKWPERIVFDTSAPMPHVAVAASSVKVDPVQPIASVIPDRAREALAQLPIPDNPRMQGKKSDKQAAQRQQKIARRHLARPPVRIARRSDDAWFGGPMWW